MRLNETEYRLRMQPEKRCRLAFLQVVKHVGDAPAKLIEAPSFLASLAELFIFECESKAHLLLSPQKSNIFREYAGFFGPSDMKKLCEDFLGWLPPAKEIRERLGEQGYLLDVYLGIVFEAFKTISTEDSAVKGNEDSQKLWYQLPALLEGKKSDFKASDEKKQEIIRCQISSQDKLTRNSSILATQVTYYMEDGLLHFFKSQKSAATIDIIEMHELYMEIGTLLNDYSTMARLNDELVKSFRIVTPTQAYLQGVADHLLVNLLYRDRESSRQIFQLLMEER